MCRKRSFAKNTFVGRLLREVCIWEMLCCVEIVDIYLIVSSVQEDLNVNASCVPSLFVLKFELLIF